MRRFLLILLLLLPLCAAGQTFSSSGQTNQYPFEYSGIPVNTKSATMWMDFSQDPSGATITSSDGGYTLTKNGTPSRVEDYTFPAGISGSHGYAHSFDGSSYWSIADGSGGQNFDFSGSFSLQMVVTPSLDGNDYAVGKFAAAGNQRGWLVYIATNGNIALYVSDDGTSAGGHYSNVSCAACLTAGVPSFVTITYDTSGGDGSCEGNIYVDNLATATDATLDGPIYDNSADFTIGAGSGGTVPINADFHELEIYDGLILSESEHDESFAKWQGRLSMEAGGLYTTVASSSPPSVMVDDGSNLQPFMLTPPADSAMVDRWGGFNSRQVDNYCERASFKTWGGAGDATGWTETLGGAGTILEENTNVAHGDESVKFTTTGAGDDVELVGACVNIDETTNYNFSIWHKKASGTADLYVTVKGYSDAACTLDEVAELSLTPGDVASTWDHTDAKLPTGGLAGTTDYVTITIGQADIAGVVYVDAVSLNKQTLHSHNFCGCDTDALCSCDDMVHEMTTPPVITVGDWTVTGKGKHSADFSEAAESRYAFNIEGTAGNNNRVMVFVSGGNISCRIYDSAGNPNSSAVTSPVAADTEFEWSISHRQEDGAVLCCLDGVCDSTPATGANMDGVGTVMTFGGSSDTDGRNSWVYDVKFFDEVLP